MSRSAAATAAGRTRTVKRGPAVPRRVSGPAAPPRGDDGRSPRPPRARIDARALAYTDGAVAGRYGALPARRARTYAAPRPQRLAYGGVAIASRVAGVALDVSASRFMDRVVRGRVWIGVIAVSLFGLVAMQVSLLKLNSGIARAVQTVGTLERSNSALRSDITRLSAGERIKPLAEGQGLVMPAPVEVGYLRAGDRHSDAVRAARRMRAPDPAGAGVAGTAPAPDLDAGVTPPSGVAATTGSPAATTVAPGMGAPGAPGTTAGAPGTSAGAPGSTSAAPGATTGAPGATTGAAAPVTGATAPASAPAATTAAPAATTAPPIAAQPAGAPPASVSGGASPQPATTQP